jgi:LPXTG-site transpeptidase (sortase) family protein
MNFINKFIVPAKDLYVRAASIIKTTSTTEVSPMKAATLSSIRLEIPKIKIDTNLEQVGLTSQGAVGVPKSILKAAWFNGSPLPGQIGNSIIVGHFGYIRGVAAIFNNLVVLRPGDKIYVAINNGSPTTFIVKKMQSYSATAKIPEIFISSDGKAHLNLITCDGVWNKLTQNYSQRLIIYTSQE